MKEGERRGKKGRREACAFAGLVFVAVRGLWVKTASISPQFGPGKHQHPHCLDVVVGSSMGDVARLRRQSQEVQADIQVWIASLVQKRWPQFSRIVSSLCVQAPQWVAPHHAVWWCNLPSVLAEHPEAMCLHPPFLKYIQDRHACSTVAPGPKCDRVCSWQHSCWAKLWGYI